jgi:sugar lactone lactonase YvrE/acetyl esterase/lipase
MLRDSIWLFVYLPLFTLFSLLANSEANSAISQQVGQRPVDRRVPLEEISTDFEMADGPAWDGYSLIIPDVKGEKLFRYLPAKKQMQTLLPESGRISASFYNHGRLFLSDNPGGKIAFLDGKNKSEVASFESVRQEKEKPYRPNDLVVDQNGGIYVTFTPQNKVAYIDPDGNVSIAVENIATPNGITMSPDEKTLYVSSFVPKKIWAYDIVAPGKTVGGRMIASMDEGPDRGADGMTIDRAGNIYCAGPADIWIWSPDGKLLDKIACPSKPINCTFGDQDMRSLYITGPGGLYRQRMLISGRSPEPSAVSLKPAANHPRKKNLSQPSTSVPDNVVAHRNVVFAQDGQRKLLMDIFVPTNATASQPKPALVVVHGGGWRNGDKTKFRALAIKLASHGYVTAAIEYRLADEAAFPAAMHDCTAAVRFLRGNAETYRLDPQKIGAVGGSAGGHLTGLMASGGGNPKLKGEGGNSEQSSRIQASIVMAGPLEMLTGSVADRSRQPDSGSNSNVWLRSTVDENPALYGLADACAQIDASTCPILFMVGEQDNPARNQPARDKLKSLGIETDLITYPNAKHGCWNRQPWFEEMAGDMVKFFNNHF